MTKDVVDHFIYNYYNILVVSDQEKGASRIGEIHKFYGENASVLFGSIEPCLATKTFSTHKVYTNIRRLCRPYNASTYRTSRIFTESLFI